MFFSWKSQVRNTSDVIAVTASTVINHNSRDSMFIWLDKIKDNTLFIYIPASRGFTNLMFYKYMITSKHRYKDKNELFLNQNYHFLAF